MFHLPYYTKVLRGRTMSRVSVILGADRYSNVRESLKLIEDEIYAELII